MNTQKDHKPYATKTTIHKCALRLLQQNGMTTTLEVKMDLRQQGYIAFQSDISHWMDRVAYEEGWHYICNGEFRVYSQVRMEPWLMELLILCPN